MRGHNPILLEDFNGLYVRGDKDSTPADHFTSCSNIKFSESSFLNRDGIGPSGFNYKNVKRIYIFNQSLLVLDIDGNIYHSDRGSNSNIPILSISGMGDFGFVKFANRAYITPKGVTDFIYVYTYGDAAGARKAAGPAPLTAPTLTAVSGGNTEQGVHVFAVVYETDTGFLTQLSPGVSINLLDGESQVQLDNVSVSPSAYVTKRHIVATRAVDPADFTGDLNGYEFFFIPDATIDDNTGTSITVNFYDAELLEDASYLQDLYDEIPNQAGLTLYHTRLVGWASPRGSGGEHLSEIILSFPGEPEAISKVDGLIALPRDGKPISICQDYRDVLYIFKSSKTASTVDNGDVPSSWAVVFIDQGLGTETHALATVLDSGSIDIDYLLVGNYTGINIFNGAYQFPPITYKVQDIWPGDAVQIVVEPNSALIYVVFPNGQVLVGDYRHGLNPMSIRWALWDFAVKITCAAILEEGGIKVLFGSTNT